MPAEESSSSGWSREQDKQFEKAIVSYSDSCPDRWERIAADVCGKSVEEVKRHYELLADDVKQIESGFIQVPCYNVNSDGSTSPPSDGATRKRDGKSSRSDQERRKGIAWTEDEHRLFLLGLDKYGKGDWRSISRNFVVTRNPTQVASHAQKYFIRLNSMNKDRRRSSIHDITSVDSGDVSAPITGKSSISPVMGQPVGGPVVSAVGTPVSLPLASHLGYYPVQHTPGQR